jgi:hypothetical protein
MNDEDQNEIYLSLFAMACGQLLKNDEGIIVHYDGVGYAVYKNSNNGTVAIMSDEQYADLDPGTMIWMHYEGSLAPEPASDERDMRGAEPHPDDTIH